MARDDANLEIVCTLYACFGRGDLAGLMALLHDDVDWVWNGPAVIPYAGARRGHSGVGALLRSLSDSLAIEELAPRRFLAKADTVVVVGDERARVTATARSFATSWAHVWTVRAGKIASVRCFADTAAIAAAFQP